MEPVYDPTTRALHWLNAILAALAVALAYGISGTARPSDARELLLMLHGSVGLAILAAMLLWGGWRLRHPAPPRRPLLTRIELYLAHATQGALFVLFIAMPISGYTMLAAAGQPVSFFGLVVIPPLVPQSGRLAQTAVALHLLGEFLIYGLLVLHIGAALVHGFIRRDGIFERMLPRRF
ncbi:MAG TPA: cytochrome b [Stellaceae bacterium]|nr:cytochrome b [Stellaceae bacterium]